MPFVPSARAGACVVAIAELSDGSFWSARANVVVTLAACLEEA